ncbi:hypothetical protein SAMD00019534_075420 [Acytostelium subglobosum LB1]|uniref:hypothetical protein n=1 Tax=Acytostelium subglobosum LB1 TaxID=1410327 RepID=UPI000644E790|nr:hypothetical protein SAMD00019534_075420 [Acytostelium subglobosum LB1]GAM24367.1 hypothetical protein SAMD00019534_075420 [Acytostelium subglobosum LB1]|eukprot:XP_012752693.1 hypothetical protein SAMD00019534_075420 [Acytostelium subglobosum LB1]
MCIVDDTPQQGRCRLSFYKHFGDECRNTYDCVLGLVCSLNGDGGTGWRCGAPHTGCIVDFQCPERQICLSNGTCVPANLKPGECILFSKLDMCNLSTICSPVSTDLGHRFGVCKGWSEVGDLCIVGGYTCNLYKALYCRPLKFGSRIGRCNRAEAPTLRPCYQNTDCESPEFCKCDTQASIGYCTHSYRLPAGCTAIVWQYARCAQSHNCSGLKYDVGPMSCINKHCTLELNCFRRFCLEPLIVIADCSKSREERCDNEVIFEAVQSGKFKEVVDPRLTVITSSSIKYFMDNPIEWMNGPSSVDTTIPGIGHSFESTQHLTTS